MSENNQIPGLKIRRWIVVILFLACISMPLLDYVLNISGSYANVENRTKAKLPTLKLAKLDPFPSRFDNYYADNFRFRGELLQLNNLFNTYVFNVAPEAKVIIGDSDWMYLPKYIHTYENKQLFTSLELDTLHVMFTERTRWLSARGIKHYLFIVPTKPNVYPEYLPDYVKQRNSRSRTTQLVAHLSDIDGFKPHYLGMDLLEEKDRSSIRMFHKTDQHWNDYGGLIGLQGLINVLREDYPALNPVDISDYRVDSTQENGLSLSRMLLMEEEKKEQYIRVRSRHKGKRERLVEQRYPIPETFPYKRAYQFFYQLPDSTLPAAMVNRDSYTDEMHDGLAERFSRTSIFWDNWQYGLNKEVVEKEKPDLFITIIIEAYLPYILCGPPQAR